MFKIFVSVMAFLKSFFDHTEHFFYFFFQLSFSSVYSRLQRQRSFWSAPGIATSGQVQRRSGFEWLCKHNRLRPEPIRFVTLDSEHAQSDVESVNRGLPVLDQARRRDSWCWPKEARRLGISMPSVLSNIRRDYPTSWPLIRIARLKFVVSAVCDRGIFQNIFSCIINPLLTKLAILVD